MTIYVTREGDKLVADSPLELVEKLQQYQGRMAETREEFMTRMAAQMVATQGLTVPITDPENFIAELIHNDFLSVVDSIDG
ncbi:MAG: hypothetical protein EWV53_19465 [Microcystis panniformis Mp_MB_F_20051200_S9]|uniref:Uncharacterized protein n=1 Tax=Microcystis panniformis Mp_MB_F_20051200_S9 TaxID=2486223 RepID=A0A552PMK7_9CHRO|nr:MAG: hypothetical protein EWV87_11500 [Microcystis panniformis Mp_GB_SS_20050300_S99]TRV50270.1 MAG: hypothetical protein EWV42_11685 [Microcystis panniformis Mp_GB_SS_20050300_S99D]TRV52554.1 MAG: hypothetical protein EWV43_01905 [Microcystis panniformis Mp_MB_F_20080800_S26D]TRV58122.1 MAG: hypothetical protein EWV53_19465 [Microcystis panniformis Mp_MB_F_20051200_S9]TRV58588.1 MAG: hypothetical protein EWV86_19105 [Microcystis panniformis Mp_MB_F_20051200_S9D]TRV63721.1 MAG: hypothetical